MNNLHIICITNKKIQNLTMDGIQDPYVHFKDNFITGLNKNVWGFNDKLSNSDIKEIKAGDLVLFIQGVKGTARGHTVDTVEKIQYKQLVICKATTDLIREKQPKNIWINEYHDEEKYPNRFHFEILGSHPKLTKDKHNNHYVISKKLHELKDTTQSKIYTKTLLLLMSWIGKNAIIKNVKVNLQNIHEFKDIDKVLDLSEAKLISVAKNKSQKTSKSDSPTKKTNPTQKISKKVSPKKNKQQDKVTITTYAQRRQTLEKTLGPNETSREGLVRLYQKLFRADLDYFYEGKCLVSKISISEILTASHIIPWAETRTDMACLDPANGILLSANIDRLFDRKLISINPSTLMIETCQDPKIQEFMKPYLNKQLEFPFSESNPDMLENTIQYLNDHYKKFLNPEKKNVKNRRKVTTATN